MSYSESIAKDIAKFLDSDDWNYSFEEDKGFFKFGLSIKGNLKKIDYLIDVKDDCYIVYAVSPLGADSDSREMMLNMADFVCRANYGLMNGNFELDMRDGEIRFKSFVDCDGITLSNEVIRGSIYCPAAMFSRYGLGITGIIFNDMTAEDAIAKCEV